ncbi:MAG: four-helix bundle copper-binding protein [Pacificimonas sp.]
MSIAKMIASHPDVDGHLNDPLAEAVRHAMYAAAIGTSCADACVAEEHIIEMRQCFRKASDMADVATMFVAVATRRTGSNQGVIDAAMTCLKTALTACAEECERHDQDHCERCGRMCRELLDDLKKASL